MQCAQTIKTGHSPVLIWNGNCWGGSWNCQEVAGKCLLASVLQPDCTWKEGLTVCACIVRIVELTILKIMRALFANYAHLFRFCITRRLIQDRQNSLPPSSKTSDFLYCLAWSAALTLAEWSLLLSGFFEYLSIDKMLRGMPMLND